MAGQPGFDLAALRDDVLNGREVGNERLAALLPILAANGAELEQLNASGALHVLGEDSAAQLPYMASLARHSYLASNRQRRGLAVWASTAGMGGRLAESKKGRGAKRPRLAAELQEGGGEEEGMEEEQGQAGQGAAGAAAGGERFYPSPGPSAATTFHPPRSQNAQAAPSLAVRRFSYLDLPLSQKQPYQQLHSAARPLAKEDPRKKQLREQSKQLPGTLQWAVAECIPVTPVAAGDVKEGSVTAASKEGSTLWLAVEGMADLEPAAGRSIFQVCNLHPSVDGYRTADRLREGGFGIKDMSAAPEIDPSPPGAVVRRTHQLDLSSQLYYFRLADEAPDQPAAPPAGQPQQQQQQQMVPAQQQQMVPVQQQQLVPLALPGQAAVRPAVLSPGAQHFAQQFMAAAAMSAGGLAARPGQAVQLVPAAAAGFMPGAQGMFLLPAGQGQAPPAAVPAFAAAAAASGAAGGAIFGAAGAAAGPADAAAAAAGAGAAVGDLLSEASEDRHFRSLVVGQAQVEQPPAGANLPVDPALDVRNSAVLRKDLHVLGQLFTKDGKVHQLSDERLKTQVTALEGSLQLISRLEPVEFSWRDDPSGRRVTGFLAQQLQKVLPEATAEAPDGTLFVSLPTLLPHLVGAFKELSSQQDGMEDECGELEGRVAQLEALLPALLCGGFHSLCDQQASAANGSRPLPRGKGLGSPAQPAPASATLVGRPAAVPYQVSAAAVKLFAGKSPAWVVDFLKENLEESNQGLLKKFQKWALLFGAPVMAQLFIDATSGPTSPRTRGGEFIQRAKGLERDMKQGELAEEAGASRADERTLRGYQAAILAHAAAGHNVIVVAPTGAGKRHLPGEDDRSKFVFLAPTINLADQQAAEFRTSPPFNSPKFRVDCRCGGKTVGQGEWRLLLKTASVFVLTPAIFSRLLASGEASFDDIRVLYLDECHNAQGKAPMTEVLDAYRTWLASKPADHPATQVIGFTATPANKRTVGSTLEAMEKLKAAMGAEFFVVDPEHPEVKQHVAQAQEQRLLFQPRQADREWQERLGGALLSLLSLLERHLLGLGPPEGMGEGSEDDEAGDGQLPPELSLGREAWELLSLGLFSPQVEQWCAAASKWVEASPGADMAFKADLTLCLSVFREALCGLSVASNMGWEAAARRLAQLVADTVQQLLGVRTEVLLGRMAGSPSGPLPTRAGTSAGSAGCGADLDGVTMEALCLLGQRVLGQATLLEAYREGTGGSPKSPKYQAMKSILLQHREQADAHAIIFVRTRSDSRVLHSILQTDKDLSFLTPHLLMGHGGGSDGMDVKEQRLARESFAAEGQHVLVATAAAEEGLNVTSCHCVIRFNAPQTGREKQQSKGRTRMQGSWYYELVEEGTLEERLAHKSAIEERNLHFALQHLQAFRLH